MGVKLTSTAGYDIVGGSQDSNITSYSVVTDTTSQNPSNYAGGTTRATVDVNQGRDVFLAFGEEAKLVDDVNSNVNFTGDISVVGESDFLGTTLTLDSVLSRLNVNGTVPPSMPGRTLSVIVQNFITAAGLPTMPITYQRNSTYVVPGWTGNLLDGLKQLMSAIGMTIDDAANGVITVRELNPAVTVDIIDLPSNVITTSRDVSAQTPVYAVDVDYMNWEGVTNRQVYPYTLESPTSIVVNARETQRFEFKLNASIKSVVQPTARAIIDINSPSFSSVSGYVVTSNEGIPVQPAEWNASGGRVTVNILEHDLIEVVVTGMDDARTSHEGPYRIAHVYDNTEQPALFITGTGVRSNVDTVTLYTGTSRASEDSRQHVSNIFISSAQEAYDRGQWAAGDAALSQSFSFDSTLDLRAGMLVRSENVVYRITGKTITRGKFSYSAIMETAMREFNRKFGSGVKISVFNSMWGSRKLRQASVEPLRGN